MTWRDQLRPASFRGVPFHVEADELTGGRRTVEHEHPETDGVTAEDLGRQHRRLRLTAYVLGAEYMAARDRLLAALEEGGPGSLVHPQFGERQVVVARDGISLRHSTREGGMCRFELSLIEVDDAEVRPVAVSDTEARVEAAADAADQEEIIWSGEALDISGAPGWTVDSVLDQVDAALRLIDGPFAEVRNQIAMVQGVLGRGTSLYGRGLSLLGQPGALVRGLIGLVNILPLSRSAGRTTLATPARRAALTVARTAPAALAPSTATTPTTASRRRQRQLQQAVAGSVARVAVVAAARASAAESFASRQDAEAVRDALSDALDDVLLTAPDGLYPRLATLHAATVAHLTAQAAGAVPLRRLQTTTTRPSLALAHDLYGDDPARALAAEADLVARNRRFLRHPGFVPGGLDLEVLAR